MMKIDLQQIINNPFVVLLICNRALGSGVVVPIPTVCEKQIDEEEDSTIINM